MVAAEVAGDLGPRHDAGRHWLVDGQKRSQPRPGSPARVAVSVRRWPPPLIHKTGVASWLRICDLRVATPIGLQSLPAGRSPCRAEANLRLAPGPLPIVP